MSIGIQRLTARNYGCLRDVDIRLGPLHALIGPNDSGKSTILAAAHTLAALSSSGGLAEINEKLRDRLWSRIKEAEKSDGSIACCLEKGYLGIEKREDTGRLTFFASHKKDFFERRGNTRSPEHTQQYNGPAVNHLAKTDEISEVFRPLLSGARLVQLDPEAMREPSKLIPEKEPISFLDDGRRGAGLAGVYDAIKDRNVSDFIELQDRICKLFENIEALQTPAVSSTSKILRVRLKSGQEVPAEYMSEGLLYFLAFAALENLAPRSLLLVEEPENGLHPARVKDVMRVLREMSKTSQVLIATHSPLVVNELEPSEVSVVTRTVEEGSRVTPINETRDFSERFGIYALGELWLSYADGEHEAALLEGGPRR